MIDEEITLKKLEVFLSFMRLHSLARVSEELGQSTVSVHRALHSLEEGLRCPLFRREGRSVKLTEVGRRYFIELSGALGRIRGATLQAMSHHAGAGTLRLATLPTFGSKWLLPHLHDFYAAHPGVTVHLHSRIGGIDFHTDDLDAAITVGAGDWPGLHAHRLYNEFLIAIASPDAGGGREAGPNAPAWAAGRAPGSATASASTPGRPGTSCPRSSTTSSG